jgi:RNA polymerase sigma-70 factor (ECF subfamily)
VFQSQREFERVVLPHAASLLRFARRLQGGGQAAEDLVQETLLLAWRGFRRFETNSNARAWLFRILINAFYGQGRKAHTSPKTVPITEHRSSGSSATERLEVQQAMAGLSDEHRAVLLLAVVEGFTSREISDMLSIPAGTVMSRLSRARQALREVLTSVHSAKDS